jgi:hypothetical protein
MFGVGPLSLKRNLYRFRLFERCSVYSYPQDGLFENKTVSNTVHTALYDV